MFEEGIILFFDPFYFKNGNTAKSKYFIVLKSIENKIILASLPSSKDFVSISWEKQNKCSCIEIPDANFNCYYFAAGIKIATNDWSFPKNTYLYGHQIEMYETEILSDIYPVEGLDYEIKGKLSDEIFEELLNCFRYSSSVKRKFKRLL